MQQAWTWAVWLDEASALADLIVDRKAQYEQERESGHLICAGVARARWLRARDMLEDHLRRQPPRPPLLWMDEDLGPYRLCGENLVEP